MKKFIEDNGTALGFFMIWAVILIATGNMGCGTDGGGGGADAYGTDLNCTAHYPCINGADDGQPDTGTDQSQPDVTVAPDNALPDNTVEDTYQGADNTPQPDTTVVEDTYQGTDNALPQDIDQDAMLSPFRWVEGVWLCVEGSQQGETQTIRLKTWVEGKGARLSGGNFTCSEEAYMNQLEDGSFTYGGIGVAGICEKGAFTPPDKPDTLGYDYNIGQGEIDHLKWMKN